MIVLDFGFGGVYCFAAPTIGGRDVENSFNVASGAWTLQGVSQCARDSAAAAAEQQSQTLGEWMTLAIGCYIQHERHADRGSDWPDPVVSESDSNTYQSDVNEQSDASGALVRNMNDLAARQPGNRGDATAEPPRFD
jgi:hypothetical protein